jgi:hypothetical protein
VSLCTLDNLQRSAVDSLKEFISPFNRVGFDLDRQRKSMQISLAILNNPENLRHSSVVATDQLWNTSAEGVGAASDGVA